MTLLMRELIHCICYAPSAFISDLACAQMLHIKKPPRYALIMTLLHIVPQLIFASLNNLDSEGLPVLNSVIQISLYFLGPMIASRDSVPRRLFAASLCLGASLLASTAAELIFVSLGGDIQANVGIIESGPAAYIAMFVLSFAILVILLPLLLRVWNRLIRENADTHFWEYLLYPATQAVILAIAIRYTTFDSFIPARHIALAIVTALSVIADFLLLRSIREHASRAVDTARAEWFEQLLEQQQSYYEHILSDQEDAAKIRHDFRNQLQTAYSLVDSGDREAARAQLDEIRATVEQSADFCENRVVNALLQVKASRFDMAGIPFSCRCRLPEGFPLKSMELCSLFSNVLDNAYRAAGQAADPSRGVSLVCSVQGSVLTLRCVNPCLPGNSPSAPGHGLGLEILRDLAQRYDGSLETARDGEIFTTIVQLIAQ